MLRYNENYVIQSQIITPMSDKKCDSKVRSLEITSIDNHVYFEWKTSKNEFLHFEIEKSTDMLRKETIKNMFGISADATDKSYIFIDLKPSKGLNYYRIKMINEEGNVYYTDWHKIYLKDN